MLKALLAATESRLLAYESLDKEEMESGTIKPINETSVISIRYSDETVTIEDMSCAQNDMRILEGIIRSTEQRLIYCTL